MLLDDAQIERFMKKLGTEVCQERLGVVHKYIEKWGLSAIEFQPWISWNNLIFYAISEKYGKVIFKVLLNNGFDKEIAAMQMFQGKDFCKLYEFSFEDKVYIMERVVPAITLYEGTTQKERINVIAELMKELHKEALPETIFPTYMEWFEYGKKETGYRKDCDHLLPYLTSAETVIHNLYQTYTRKVLLHGDLHHENILKNERGGYTIIDPKGVIGDPVFDLSRFILDEFRDNLAAQPKEVVIEFVRSLGEKVGIPCEVLLQCLFVETVIWLFREELAKGESLEECECLIANMKVAYDLYKV